MPEDFCCFPFAANRKDRSCIDEGTSVFSLKQVYLMALTINNVIDEFALILCSRRVTLPTYKTFREAYSLLDEESSSLLSESSVILPYQNPRSAKPAAELEILVDNFHAEQIGLLLTQKRIKNILLLKI